MSASQELNWHAQTKSTAGFTHVDYYCHFSRSSVTWTLHYSKQHSLRTSTRVTSHD